MRSRLLLIAVGFIVIATLGWTWTQGHYDRVDPKQVYSQAERAKLIEQANAGDAKSSWRLYLYYSFVQYIPEQRERWLITGANSGDERAIYSLAMFYTNIDSQRMDLSKASHWADILERRDAREASSVRKEIERVRKEQNLKRF